MSDDITDKATVRMSDLKGPKHKAATIFLSGYGLGFRQIEVKQVRFDTIAVWGGGEYDGAVFVEIGKRKEQTLPLKDLVIVEGLGHPHFEDIAGTKSTSSWGSVTTPRFSVFDPGWDQLLDEYLSSNNLMAKVIVDGRKAAKTVRQPGDAAPAWLPQPDLPQASPTIDSDSATFLEGSMGQVTLDRFERDSVARATCLAHYGFRCRACDTLMSDLYGPLGERFIHVHHRVPLSDIRAEHRVDPLRDLVPVCPNCHAMIHRTDPPTTVEELAEIVRRRLQTGS